MHSLSRIMARELRSFDLQVLLRHYCLVINEVPSAEELIDQEESFSISTLFSIKKNVAVKAAKLFAMLWKHFDYPASSLLRDTNVLAAYQLRYRSPSFPYTYLARNGDIELDSKELFFWGHRHAVVARMRNFPFLYRGHTDERSVLKVERELYTRTYVAVLCALWSSVVPSVVSGVVAILREMKLHGNEDPRRPNWEALLEYSSAHQRSLDGECQAIMTHNADFARDFPDLLGNDTSCSSSKWRLVST